MMRERTGCLIQQPTNGSEGYKKQAYLNVPVHHQENKLHLIFTSLKFSFDFKSDEINKNKKTLIEGQNRIPDFMGFLGELKKGARLAENHKGYVIGAIKRKLKEI